MGNISVNVKRIGSTIEEWEMNCVDDLIVLCQLQKNECDVCEIITIMDRSVKYKNSVYGIESRIVSVVMRTWEK